MRIEHSTTDSIEILAPAKINLYLQVLNKRPDGYHSINSLMQAVSLFDRLRFCKRDQPECIVTLTTEEKFQPINDNLISRAFDLMKAKYGLQSGIDVQLEKKIPIAAGMGGGSSDCAATILAVNHLFDLGLEKNEMEEISFELGSDIPFFFSRGQAVVSGRGEHITETDYPVDYGIVLVSPPLSFSTAESYAALKMDLTCYNTPFKLSDCRFSEEYIRALSKAGNDFEQVQLKQHPILGEIKEELINCGASLVRMSGSGPTIFGIFLESLESERVRRSNFFDCQLYTVEPFFLP